VASDPLNEHRGSGHLDEKPGIARCGPGIRGGAAKLPGKAEKLAPALVNEGRIPAEKLVLFRYVGVVEHAGDGA
jgi:hypothetical protein